MFSTLFTSFRNVMSPKSLTVAYLGPPASFSEQAAQEAFPPSTPATLRPLPSFRSIFQAVQDSSQSTSDAFDFAVVPIENSTNGGVVQVLDLLIQCGLEPSSCHFPDVEVVAEHYLEVHHCIYVHPSVVKTSATQDNTSSASVDSISQLGITTLYSHPQVWGQCENFLSKHFLPAHTERVDMSSTSAAAAYVAKHPPSAESSKPDEIPAAICSSLAGAQNGLSQVASNIEDAPGKNSTRFLIIRNSRRPTPLPPHLTQPLHPAPATVFHKFLITFTVPHTVPGSLASALAVFGNHAVNLTAITSRPSKEMNWHYVFFVECKREAPPGEEDKPSVAKGLVEDLEKVAERTCCLGGWVDRLRRTL